MPAPSTTPAATTGRPERQRAEAAVPAALHDESRRARAHPTSPRSGAGQPCGDGRRPTTAGAGAAAPAFSDANSTVAVSTYGSDDRCWACGEHIANPHAPSCPAEAATSLREDAEANDVAHRATTAAGGYTDDSEPGEIGQGAQVGHDLVATTQCLAADLLEMDHAGAIDLRTWPAAAALLAHVGA